MDENENLINKLIRWWKTRPQTTKSVIVPVFFTGLKLVLVVFMAVLTMFIILAPISKVFDIGVERKESKISYSEALEKIGNFLVFGSYLDNESLIEELEYDFYEKIEDVADEYREKKNVEIDTVLLASTLLYEQDMGEILEELTEDDLENYSSKKQENAQKKFFNRIMKEIEPLAEHQVFTRRFENYCISTSGYIKREPEDIIDVALNSEYNNTQTIKTYQKRSNDPLVPCPFEDVTSNFQEHYNKYSVMLEDATEREELYCKFADIDGPMPELDTNLGSNNENKSFATECYAATSDRKKAEINLEYVSMFFVNGKFKCASPYSTGSDYDGCAEKPKSYDSYFTDNSYEGYYYYKISAQEDKKGKTVIEKLYPEVFDVKEELIDITRQEVIDEVFDLYHTFVAAGFNSSLEIGEFFSIRTQAVEEPSDPAYDYYWSSKNRFYTSGVSGNYPPGQCTTYVYGRLLEIEDEIGITCGDSIMGMQGHAAQWITNTKLLGKNFEISTNINAPRPGAIIVWAGGGEGYGHVALIEKVYRNESGDIVVDFSEGNTVERQYGDLTGQGFRYQKGVKPESYATLYGARYFSGYIYAVCTENLVDISEVGDD